MIAGTFGRVEPGDARRGRTLIILGLVLLGCSESEAPGGGSAGRPTSAVLVSSTFARPAGGAISANPARMADPASALTWVSMVPGTDSDGVAVAITNLRSQGADSFPMSLGGLDPVGVPARDGDTLQILISRRDGQRITSYAVVPVRSRPAVVRTAPASHKTDVPLNMIGQIVFSQPMDSATLIGAVSLTRFGVKVAGTVSVVSANGLVFAARFTPAAALRPNTSYQLSVATSAADLRGSPLAALVQATFQSAAAATALRIISPLPGDTLPTTVFTVAIDFGPGQTVGNLKLTATPSGNQVPQVLWDSRSAFPGTFYVGNPMESSVMPGLPAGEYTLQVSMNDSLGRPTVSPPVAITLVDPVADSRIMVNSFTALEYQDTRDGNVYYAPQMVVTDTVTGGGLEIEGFAWPASSTPNLLFAGLRLRMPGQVATQIFAEYSGDYIVGSRAPDTVLVKGGLTTGRLFYHYGGRQFYTDLQGTVLPGSMPETETFGCWHWVIPTGFLWAYCPPDSPASVRRPAVGATGGPHGAVPEAAWLRPATGDDPNHRRARAP